MRHSVSDLLLVSDFLRIRSSTITTLLGNREKSEVFKFVTIYSFDQLAQEMNLLIKFI